MYPDTLSSTRKQILVRFKNQVFARLEEAEQSTPRLRVLDRKVDTTVTSRAMATDDADRIEASVLL